MHCRVGDAGRRDCRVHWLNLCYNQTALRSWSCR